MKTLDRTNVRQLSEAFLNALKPLEKTFGVKINYKSGRFSPTNVTFKFDASVVGATGEVLAPERTAFKAYAVLHGLNADWLDQEFSWCGNTYKVTGLKPRCWKSPVLVTRVQDGKKYKMSVQMISDSFKLKGLK